MENAESFARERAARLAAESLNKALRESEQRYRLLIQSLPAAAYICDADGYIQLYNDAAAALWGREPVTGQDKWCGSVRMFQGDGAALPLEESPMAVALREARSVRGREVVIERRDGGAPRYPAAPDAAVRRRGALHRRDQHAGRHHGPQEGGSRAGGAGGNARAPA